uniref:Transmembrane protein n=1 Tax=Strongyloides venezuelensis TaxID=75913 RepID=A0A0K0FJ60_STRVS
MLFSSSLSLVPRPISIVEAQTSWKNIALEGFLSRFSYSIFSGLSFHSDKRSKGYSDHTTYYILHHTITVVVDLVIFCVVLFGLVFFVGITGFLVVVLDDDSIVFLIVRVDRGFSAVVAFGVVLLVVIFTFEGLLFICLGTEGFKTVDLSFKDRGLGFEGGSLGFEDEGILP